jgi:hypothetical protein
VPSRYIFAVVAACFVTATAFWLSWYWNKSLLDQFHQSLHKAAATGELPDELKGLNLDNVPLEGFDIKGDGGVLFRYELSTAIAGLWFLWIPMVFAICLGTAYAAGRWVIPPQASNTPASKP